MNKTIIILLLLVLSTQLKAQTPFQHILKSIQENNPQLKAQRQYVASQKVGYKTGLTPSNPQLEYNRILSQSQGNPVEVLIKQELDFPTIYFQRIAMSKDLSKNLDNQIQRTRQKILLDAKLCCIELTFLNKQKLELIKRHNNAIQLKEHFINKFNQGDATLLDLNKAKLAAQNTLNQVQLNKMRINEQQEKLRKLNGGKSILWQGTDYPDESTEKDLQQLIKQLQPLDPLAQELIQNEKIASRKITINKMKALPSLSIGYKYINSDISKKVNGIQLGVSIPLWENKNRVKQAKLNRLYHQEALISYQINFNSEIKQLWDKYQILQQSLQQYNNTLNKANNTKLLKQAMTLGEISSIEYFMELTYYYLNIDTYLELQLQYHKVLAQMQRYKL